jgi:hypothetical protein
MNNTVFPPLIFPNKLAMRTRRKTISIRAIKTAKA